MFKKVLIANRGEIACRIIRTLKHMGIKTVGVYSEVDEEALHVEMADEAYLIGSPPVRESYLNSQTILNVAQKSGVDAVHPGYGFLSENALFAEEVEKAGLVFIGPSSDVIRAMGDKLEAKRLARLAGVSCLPGTDEPLKTLHEAEKMAHDMGCPLMVKAAAGGGGKGMRIVHEPSALAEAIKGAIHEANSSFGDERVFLEKYIDSARHIEIQILGDHEGNIIHLGERECSLQRRHQKVIEEAPSPFVTPALRKEMGNEAIRLAKFVKYTSAGTVEFVVDPEGNFYFLEMNTRLQVEHPTTEMITGIDLVEEMVRIAAGEPLRFQQSDVKFKGHAIEARLYAEDSARGFLPSTGRMRTYLAPLEKKGEIRLDSGVREGDVMTPYYDPMIAKLIVHQPSRELACTVLLEALNHYYVRGIATNIHFLTSLVKASFFKKGQFNTRTLDELYGDGFIPKMPKNLQIASGAAAVMYCLRNILNQATLVVLLEGKTQSLHILHKEGQWEVSEGVTKLIIETQWNPGDCFFTGFFNGEVLTLQLEAQGIRDRLFWDGYGVFTTVVTPRIAELLAFMPAKQQPDISRIVMAPMPGLIIEVAVKEGDSIKRGHPIAIMEAMKMENIIRAGCDGIIERVYVKKGESVNLDQPLAKIK